METPNTNFIITINSAAQLNEFNFDALSEKRQNAMIAALEADLYKYASGAMDEPGTKELLRKQRFEHLVVLLHHAQQLFYLNHSRHLKSLLKTKQK